MADSADVRSIDALRDLRVALVRFGEDARIALTDVDFDIRKTLDYVANDQRLHWQGEVRRWDQKLAMAKAELHRKKLAKFMDRRPDTSVEEKAVRKATLRLEEAHQKLKRILTILPDLQHEIQAYRGQSQPLGDMLERDIPNAIARLDRMTDALDAYVTMAPPSDGRGGGGSPAGRSLETMARSLDEATQRPAPSDEVPPPTPENEVHHERGGGLEHLEPRSEDPPGDLRPD